MHHYRKREEKILRLGALVSFMRFEAKEKGSRQHTIVTVQWNVIVIVLSWQSIAWRPMWLSQPTLAGLASIERANETSMGPLTNCRKGNAFVRVRARLLTQPLKDGQLDKHTTNWYLAIALRCEEQTNDSSGKMPVSHTAARSLGALTPFGQVENCPSSVGRNQL